MEIDKTINDLYRGGVDKLAIYPFGERGIYTKWILKERYGIEPVAIIDNKLAGTNGIISLEEFKEKKWDNTKILLVHENPASYIEVRQNLIKYVSIKDIVDVFSPSMYFHDNYYHALYFPDLRRINLEKAMREIYRNIMYPIRWTRQEEGIA